MRVKRYPPILLSVLLTIIGMIIFVWIYNDWHTEELSVRNPAVSKVVVTEEPDLKSIIHEAEKNVIQIEGQTEHSTITGSGFIFNNEGDIVTNAHVIDRADSVYVRTAGAEIYPAAVVGISEDVDVAILRVPQLANQSLDIAEEAFTEIGDEVIALGSPHGFQNTVTLGIISGMERQFSLEGYTYSNVYQISAQITQGNSGGPLIDRRTGKVIGINSAGTEDGLIGFSIPIHDVIDQLEQWSNETQNDQLDFPSTSDILPENDMEQLAEEADYIIRYFLDSLQVRDYVNAYALLGSNMQADTSYTDFRENYIHIISLTYADFTIKTDEEDSVTADVQVTIESNLQNEEDTLENKLLYNFEIGYENDQLKILNIKVEEE
ncbi:S1C family serine protease [Virgibacillus kimchii]